MTYDKGEERNKAMIFEIRRNRTGLRTEEENCRSVTQQIIFALIISDQIKGKNLFLASCARKKLKIDRSSRKPTDTAAYA